MSLALVFAVFACASTLVDDRRVRTQGGFNPALGATFSIKSNVVERGGVGFYGVANLLALRTFRAFPTSASSSPFCVDRRRHRRNSGSGSGLRVIFVRPSVISICSQILTSSAYQLPLSHRTPLVNCLVTQIFNQCSLFLCSSNCAARSWIVLGQALRFALDLSALDFAERNSGLTTAAEQASTALLLTPRCASSSESDAGDAFGRSTRSTASSPPISAGLFLFRTVISIRSSR